MTIFDILFLIFIVIFLFCIGLCCTYLKYKQQRIELQSIDINEVQFFDFNDRLRDNTYNNLQLES